jgi:hypothetical protein
MRVFLLLPALGFNFVYGQSKQELLEAKQKSIDSLKAIILNDANIIENRDRSIKFLNEDKTKLIQEKTDLEKMVWAKEQELQRLKKFVSTGTGKMMTFNNTRSGLKIPAGKHWVIHQVMADYAAALSLDSLGNFVPEEIHVFLKSINGTVLQDTAAGVFGPQLYSSVDSENSMSFPLILTENTSFTLEIMSGPVGRMKLYPGNVIISFSEKDN